DLAHGLLDQLRGLELLEAELRALADRLPDRDDLLALAVDGVADCALDVVECGHHVSFGMSRCGRSVCTGVVRPGRGRRGTASPRRPGAPRRGWRRSPRRRPRPRVAPRPRGPA